MRELAHQGAVEGITVHELPAVDDAARAAAAHPQSEGGFCPLRCCCCCCARLRPRAQEQNRASIDLISLHTCSMTRGLANSGSYVMEIRTSVFAYL